MGYGVISVSEAKKLIKNSQPPLQKEIRPLASLLGCVLAESVRAPVSLPLADNSAMDGFVFRSQDTLAATTERPVRLRIGVTVRAGDFHKQTLKTPAN